MIELRYRQLIRHQNRWKQRLTEFAFITLFPPVLMADELSVTQFDHTLFSEVVHCVDLAHRLRLHMIIERQQRGDDAADQVG